MQRESMEFDVVIVGAGPAGLATAIRLADSALNVCLIEKAPEVGAHSISGAVLEPEALTELIPNWKQLDAPVTVEVTHDSLYYLSSNKHHKLPLPKIMKNQGNYIISLSEFCRWLGNYAEQRGINIFPGFSVSDILYDKKNKVIGVQTKDLGLSKAGKPTDRFQAGINLLAKHTVFAEGCRGSLSERVIKKFKLAGKNPQSYGIGVKELWKISPEQHKLGTAMHTLGWPLGLKTYGGGFVYHFKDHLLSLGLVIGLDYKNPYLDPFQELQRFKLHPLIKPLLESGECISYGARALNEGGFQSLPSLSFPGGLLVGCAAGMLNVGKIKGIHNALRSGRLAAEAILGKHDYQAAFNASPIYQELYRVRNLRPGFHPGLLFGLAYAAFDQYVFFGRAPWTFTFKEDYKQLIKAKYSQPIDYQKPDSRITFDKLNQVYLTRTKHREDEPCHLTLKNSAYPVQINLASYDGPEARYCPAGVYSYVQKEGKPQLQINAANCIHCKTCDIKDPTQNIVWQVPEGGEGPFYTLM